LKVVALLRDGQSVAAVGNGESVLVILDCTPFYGESGGQVGDTGALVNASGRFEVEDTLKLAGAFHAHLGRWTGGTLKVGDLVDGRIDDARRGAVVINHTATHLLHAALRTVLGDHVQQKGSLVAPDRLRFDFAHFQPLSAEELERIE